MKRYFFTIILLLVVSLDFAQEPRNNLGKTISEMSQLFPGIMYDRYYDDCAVYKYGDEMDFYFKEGRCVKERMTVKGYGSFPQDWYNATVKSFMETNYLDYSIGKDTALFVYSSFHVFIMYQVGENWVERWASISYLYPPDEN